MHCSTARLASTMLYDYSDYRALEKQTRNLRYERGVELASQNEIIKMPKLSNNQHWLVASESVVYKYCDVSENKELIVVCDCPDYKFHGAFCKHIHAILIK